MQVIVAVNDELRPVPGQHGAKIGAVDKALEAPRRRADRRVVDHHDAKQPLAPAVIERLREPGKLLATEPSGRHEGRRRHRAGQTDQRQRAAPAQEWKGGLGGVVAAHVTAPVELRETRRPADVDVVITRHQGDVVGRPE